MTVNQVASKYNRSTIFPTGVFIVLFTLYAVTAPRTIALEDDGIFVLNGYFLGLTHPPGYPLYILCAKLATLVPFGSVAYRVHLLSAFFGALSCVALWFAVKALSNDKAVAGIAALGFGFSRIFWSQAIIAEVYTLNSLLFFTLLFIAIRIHRHSRATTPDEQRILKLAALFSFLLGLALSNHWPLTVLYGVIFPYFFWPVRYLVARHLLRLLPLLALGLSPYVWMWWRGQQPLPINTIGALPFESFEDFLSYVRRDAFAEVDQDDLATFSDKIQFIAFSVREWCRQYSLLGMPLILTGIVHAWRNYDRGLVLNLLLGCIVPQVVLLWKISFVYDYLKINIFKVYPLLGYGIAAVFFAWGTQAALKALYTRISFGWRIPAGAATGLILFAVLLSNFSGNDRSRYDWTEKYAHSLFSLLPANASVFVSGDIDMGVLGYYHLIEHLRPDISLYSGSNFFNNLAFGPKDNESVITDKLSRFIDASITPLMMVTGADINEHLDSVNPAFGLLMRIETGPDRKHFGATVLDESHVASLANLINNQEHLEDPWTIQHRSHLLRIHNYLAVCMNLQGRYLELDSDDRIGPLFARLGAVDGYLMCRNDLANAAKMLEEGQVLIHSEIDKPTLSEYYKYRGEINTIRFGVNAKATQDLAMSVAVYPSPDNAALQQLLKVYALSGNTAAFNYTAEQYLKNEHPIWYADLQGLLLQKSPSITKPAPSPASP